MMNKILSSIKLIKPYAVKNMADTINSNSTTIITAITYTAVVSLVKLCKALEKKSK